jgi:hypothetical protein
VLGKRSARQEAAAANRHRISYIAPPAASGLLQIAAYGSATLKSTSTLNILPGRLAS